MNDERGTDVEPSIQEFDRVVEVGETSESNVDAEIARLWSAHKDRAVTARDAREELKVLRRNLAQRLHEMKSLLVQTGRSGKWASYLRERKIPRATADRYVKEHELTLTPLGENLLTEAISAPTEEDVLRLFRKLLPQMRRVLVTQEAAFTFATELFHGLPAIDFDVIDEGAIIFRPKEGSGSLTSTPDSLRAQQVAA